MGIEFKDMERELPIVHRVGGRIMMVDMNRSLGAVIKGMRLEKQASKAVNSTLDLDDEKVLINLTTGERETVGVYDVGYLHDIIDMMEMGVSDKAVIEFKHDRNGNYLFVSNGEIEVVLSPVKEK